MPKFATQVQSSLEGITISPQQVTVTDNLAADLAVSVLAAQPSTLTTRTDATHGTLTMTNSGHGIVTGQRIDLYWTGGQIYNVTVGTVSGTSVPITLSTGTLPSLNAVINAGIPVKTLVAITGDNLSALLFNGITSERSYFVMATVAPVDENPQMVATNGSYQWYTGSGITNPLAGVVIASVWVSHGDTAGAHTMQAGALSH